MSRLRVAGFCSQFLSEDQPEPSRVAEYSSESRVAQGFARGGV